MKEAALIELVIPQQGSHGLHDRPLQHGQRGGDACCRLIRPLEHHAFGDLSPVRLAADPLTGEPGVGPLPLAAPAEAPAPGARFPPLHGRTAPGEVCRISDGPAGEILPPLPFQRLIQQVHPDLLDLLFLRLALPGDLLAVLPHLGQTLCNGQSPGLRCSPLSCFILRSAAGGGRRSRRLPRTKSSETFLYRRHGFSPFSTPVQTAGNLRPAP